MRMVTRRASEVEHIDTEGSWAVSYGDMITLLLSFFVLYFTVDHEKTRKQGLEQSLMLSLAPPAPVSNRKPNSVAADNGERAEKGKELEGGKAASKVGDGPTENVGDKKQIGTTDHDGMSLADVQPDLQKKWDAKVYKVGKRVIVDFPGRSFYKLGEIEPNSDGSRILVEFAKKYLPFAGSYVLGVRAYTDERKVKQTPGRRFKDNLELSALRSIAAMRILEHEGLPISRMRIGGWGVLKLSPKDLATVPTDATLRDPKALARKVVFVIEADGEES